MKDNSLEDKWILITGATGNLNRLLVRRLAENGLNIIVHYHSSKETAEKLVKDISHSGRRGILLQADLSAHIEAENLIPRAVELSGRVDFLINAASLYKESSITSLSPENLVEAVTINTLSPFLISRSFKKICNSGVIINILDARMVDYDRNHVAYSLSKQMLFSLTRMMSREFSPEVRVNAIAPGIITTPENTPPELLEKMKEATFMDRTGTPEDITEAVLYLLSNTFVTGETLFVDGGRNIRGKMFGL